MNKIKMLIIMLVLCSATMVKAQYNVPNLAGFDYTPIYDQQAASASSIDASRSAITPLDGSLQPFFVDAATPSTPQIPGGGGNGTGIIPTPNPNPLADCLWLLVGLALLATAFRVRRALREE